MCAQRGKRQKYRGRKMPYGSACGSGAELICPCAAASRQARHRQSVKRCRSAVRVSASRTISSHQQHDPPHPNSTPQRWQVFGNATTARQLLIDPDQLWKSCGPAVYFLWEMCGGKKISRGFTRLRAPEPAAARASRRSSLVSRIVIRKITTLGPHHHSITKVSR